jgi:hypothetical protein
MKRTLASLLVGGLLIVGSGVHAGPRLTPEQELTKTVEGRVAGEPVRCISLSRIQSSRIIDNTAIVYDAGGTLYVNRPVGGADLLDDWDILVTKVWGGQLCERAIVHLVDRGSQFPSGFVSLGEFVPYKKVKKDG